VPFIAAASGALAAAFATVVRSSSAVFTVGGMLIAAATAGLDSAVLNDVEISEISTGD